PVAGSGVLVAHRDVRAADSSRPARELARTLSVDRTGRPRVFPLAHLARAARCRAWARRHARLLHAARPAGARARDPSVQARYPVDHARRDRKGVPAMTETTRTTDPRHLSIKPLF